MFLVLNSNPISATEPPKELKLHPCYFSIEKQYKALVRSPQWSKDIGNKDGVLTFRSPTDSLGVWLELNAFKTAGIDLIIRRLYSVEQYSFGDSKCIPQIRKASNHYRYQFESTEFSDHYLAQILKDHSSGIIYAWSPSMPFSVQGGTIIKRVSRRLGIPVFFVLDPHAELELARKSLVTLGGDKEALRSLQSVELYQRGVGVHFPAIVLFENHKMLGQSLPGVKREDVYLRLIEERLVNKTKGGRSR